MEAVFKELREKREAWLGEPAVADDFRVAILGGAWTQQAMGKPYDNFMGKAASAKAKSWCQQYGCPASSRFSIAMYGEHAASQMASAWCHKLQYYIDISQAASPGPYRYTEDDHGGYQEPSAFTECVTALKGKQLARAQQLRSLRPKLPR